MSTHSPLQQQLMAAIQDGLPLTARPFLTLANRLNVTEQTVIDTLRHWQRSGLIKRMGLIVNHHKLGYQSNAMVVWDIPDARVDSIGADIKNSGLVNLCYRRARRPGWPYNLYCMLHGCDREAVTKVLETLNERLDLAAYPREILFTVRQFKQCGGRYGTLLSVDAQRESA